MAIHVELKSEEGKVFHVQVGEEYLEKPDFKQYLKLVKSLEDREFDSFRKVWQAPLTTDNLLKLDFWITEAEMEEMDKYLE